MTRLLIRIIAGTGKSLLAGRRADYVEARKGIVDEAGCRLVVRNGSLPERQVITGLGPVSVRQPRVRDKRSAKQREVFTLGVLPSDGT